MTKLIYVLILDEVYCLTSDWTWSIKTRTSFNQFFFCFPNRLIANGTSRNFIICKTSREQLTSPSCFPLHSTSSINHQPTTLPRHSEGLVPTNNVAVFIWPGRNILPPSKRGEVCCSRNNSFSFLGTYSLRAFNWRNSIDFKLI